MKGGTADAGGIELVRDLMLCGAGMARTPPRAIRGLTSKGRGRAEPEALGWGRPTWSQGREGGTGISLIPLLWHWCVGCRHEVLESTALTALGDRLCLLWEQTKTNTPVERVFHAIILVST